MKIRNAITSAIKPKITHERRLSFHTPNGIKPIKPPTATFVFWLSLLDVRAPIKIRIIPTKITKMPIGISCFIKD